MKDLDLIAGHGARRRPWRIATATTLVLCSGLLALEASEAAQPTVILPPSVAQEEPLPPVAGEYTSSITPASPTALTRQTASERDRTDETTGMSLGERKAIITLLLICFGVMALGSYSLWRRGLRDMAGIQARTQAAKEDE